jgi:hypothetical protein
MKKPFGDENRIVTMVIFGMVAEVATQMTKGGIPAIA